MAVLLCFAAWQVELVLVFFGLAREPFSRPFVSAWLWQRTARRIRHETRRKVAVQIWRGKPTVNLQFWRVYSVSTCLYYPFGDVGDGLLRALPWFAMVYHIRAFFSWFKAVRLPTSPLSLLETLRWSSWQWRSLEPISIDFANGPLKQTAIGDFR